jgi:hypothetical protein
MNFYTDNSLQTWLLLTTFKIRILIFQLCSHTTEIFSRTPKSKRTTDWETLHYLKIDKAAHTAGR